MYRKRRQKDSSRREVNRKSVVRKEVLETKETVGVLPRELTTDILSRLPVKSLMRFKSVSNWWKHLITHPDFSALYFQRSLQDSSKNSLLFLAEYPDKNFYSVLMDSAEKLDMTKKVGHHLNLAERDKIVGSCNGLVCIWRWLPEGGNITLYNPSTRVHHDLPSLPMDWPSKLPFFHEEYQVFNNMKFGFGYDSIGSDYKVWRMCVFDTDINDCPIGFSGKVYSLRKNSWKKIDNFPKNIGKIESDCGTLCNGNVHLVANIRPEGRGCCEVGILAFELASETYHELPRPPIDDGLTCCELHIGVLENNMCATYLPIYGVCSVYNVWVMKDYGVKESWTILCSVTDTKLKFPRHVRPLTYSRNRDEVLIDISSSEFVWYDLRNGRIKEYVSSPHHGAEICVPALVSPKPSMIE